MMQVKRFAVGVPRFSRQAVASSVLMAILALQGVMAWAEDLPASVSDTAPRSSAPLGQVGMPSIDSIWTRPSYESKMFEVGSRLISANQIRTSILFRMVQDGSELDAKAEKAHHVITVSSALFPIIRSDDELAAVLSHEIAHIIQGTNGHFAGLSLFDILGTAIFVPDALLTTASMGQSIKQRWTRATVQNRETEMDLIGVDLMVKAGYNPLAMESILDKIASDEGNKHWRSRITLTERTQRIHEAIVAHYPQFIIPAVPSVPPGDGSALPQPAHQLQTPAPGPGNLVIAPAAGGAEETVQMNATTTITPTDHGINGPSSQAATGSGTSAATSAMTH